MAAATVSNPQEPDVDIQAARWSLQMPPDQRERWLRALIECSDNVQQAVTEMISIIDDPTSTPDAKQHAATEIRRVLNAPHANDNGLDQRKLHLQQAQFADALHRLLTDKGLTQAELAARAGCSQPAISQMLSRQCRPQRRTIVKLAAALGVHPRELWPDLEVADILDTVEAAQREQTMSDEEAEAFRRILSDAAPKASASPLPKRPS
jgi:transcriptional regulator with XRE-family HTH domain